MANNGHYGMKKGGEIWGLRKSGWLNCIGKGLLRGQSTDVTPAGALRSPLRILHIVSNGQL